MLSLLIVLWWTVVIFSTLMVTSLTLVVGSRITARLGETFQRRVARNLSSRQEQQNSRWIPAGLRSHSFVGRVVLPVWFTSLVIWIALESLGAALLLRNRSFDLEPLPHQMTPTLAGQISVVAIGGSTTLGAPYHERLSFPDITGWRLEETFPALRVRVDNLAYGGAHLEDMYQELLKQKTRPDVLIVYTGHNEFLRYPPDREAATAYYGVNHPSFLSRAIALELERMGAHEGPLWRGKRRLFDRPVCTEHEESVIYRRFRRTLEAILSFSRREGILVILFVPVSSESGLAPNRSTLPDDLSLEEASLIEDIYRRLMSGAHRSSESRLLKTARRLAPDFAETWYRLGKLYEASGRYGKARKCYQRAVDADRFPVRATSRIKNIIREVGREHEVVLLDAREVMAPLARNGILGSDIIHDNCHPNLPSHVALANATLNALRKHYAAARGKPEGPSLEWPVSGYEATVASVIRHFGMDQEGWIGLCAEQGEFYKYLAVYHHDIEARMAKSRAYLDAAERLRRGTPPPYADIPGMEASAFPGFSGSLEPDRPRERS